MRIEAWLIAAVLFSACEPPCVPGLMFPAGGGSFQNLLFPMEPVEFRFDEGSCGSGLPPDPQVRVFNGAGAERRS